MNRATLFLALAVCAAAPASAATLRVSAAADAATLDPQSQAVATTYQLLDQIYEPLIDFGPTLALEPGLAAAWEQTAPTTWRFHLRRNARFHDGTKFTAADVAFSLVRAASPHSGYANYLDTITTTNIVDDTTIDINTREPDPILLNKLSKIAILSRAWCEAHDTIVPQDATLKEEPYTARHENGTGPYLLEAREEGVRTTLTGFAGWWGTMTGNVTEYVSIPIASNATRIAALLSNAVDLVLDPPVTDIERLRHNGQLRVVEGPEIRTILLEMDQVHDQLQGSDITGRNPFKDRRVRQALYQAIDIDALTGRLMRGLARPAGMVVPPGVHGYAADLDQRLPYDPEGAKRLLADAGYPEGFSFAMDCPTNRYANDAQVCAAIAAMWARIGVRTAVQTAPYQQFFPKIQRRDSSMYMLGYGSPTLDAYNPLQAIFVPPGAGGDGIWNLGYANPAVTDLVGRIRFETNQAARDALLRQALRATTGDIAVLPLYRSIGAWAMADRVNVTYRADTIMIAKWARVE